MPKRRKKLQSRKIKIKSQNQNQKQLHRRKHGTSIKKIQEIIRRIKEEQLQHATGQYSVVRTAMRLDQSYPHNLVALGIWLDVTSTNK